MLRQVTWRRISKSRGVKPSEHSVDRPASLQKQSRTRMSWRVSIVSRRSSRREGDRRGHGSEEWELLISRAYCAWIRSESVDCCRLSQATRAFDFIKDVSLHLMIIMTTPQACHGCGCGFQCPKDLNLIYSSRLLAFLVVSNEDLQCPGVK